MPIFYPGGRGPSGRGGGGRTTFNAGTFADLAALNTWGAANLNSLFNNNDEDTTNNAANVTVATVGDLTYEWSGTNKPASYPSGGAWTIRAGAGLSLDPNIPDGTLLMKSGGSDPELARTIATQNGSNGVVVDGEISSSRDSVNIGEGLTISEDGGAAKLTDRIDNLEALAAGTLLNPDGTTGANAVLRRFDPQNVVVQPNDDENQQGNWVAWVPITSTRIIDDVTIRHIGTATGVRLVLRDAANQTQTDGPILFQSHTEAQAEAGQGLTLTDGDVTIPFQNGAKLVQGRFVYIQLTQNPSGTGTIDLRGRVFDIAGITQFYSYLEQSTVQEEQVPFPTFEDLKPDIVDITGDLTINSSNVATYREKVLKYSGTANITITIAATNTFDELDTFSVWNDTTANARVTVTQTGGQVGGRNNYRLRADNFAEFTYDGTSNWLVRRQSFALADLQSDWSETDTESVRFIANKPGGVERRNTSLTINSSNVATYRSMNFIEFTNESGQVDLVIADNVFSVGDTLMVKHYSIGGVSGAQVRIEQQGTGARIDAETDMVLGMDSAIVLKYVATNTWRIAAAYNSTTSSSQEQIEDIVGAMVTGNTESGITVSYDDSNGKLDFTVSGTGAVPRPSLHELTTDIASRVDVNTTLNGSHVFTFNVTNHSQLTALELVVTGGDNITMALPTTDGQQSQTLTLTGIDTSSAGSVSFQLRGTYSGGNVTSNTVTVTVANVATGAQTYVNHQNDRVPTNFSTAGASSAEFAQTQTLTIPTFTGNDYVGIAQPETEGDITSIVIGGLEQVAAFSKVNGTFSIGGVDYEFFYSTNELVGSVVSGTEMIISRG